MVFAFLLVSPEGTVQKLLENQQIAIGKKIEVLMPVLWTTKRWKLQVMHGSSWSLYVLLKFLGELTFEYKMFRSQLILQSEGRGVWAEKVASENLHVKNCRSALKLERKGGISSGYSQDQPKADSARCLCGFCENRNRGDIWNKYVKTEWTKVFAVRRAACCFI